MNDDQSKTVTAGTDSEQRQVMLSLTHDEFLVCLSGLRLLEITTKFYDDVRRATKSIEVQTVLMQKFLDHIKANSEEDLIMYPAVTSHRKCDKCGKEMRHHKYRVSTNEAIYTE